MKSVCFSIFAAIFISGPPALAESVESEVRQEISRLSRADLDAQVALENLQTRPREMIVAIIKDDLSSYPEPRIALLRAIVQLQLKELLPNLKLVIERTDEWPAFTAVNRLLEDEAKAPRDLEVLYLRRLEEALVSPPAKAAILEGLSQWRTPVPSALYAKLMQDSSLELRRAAWRQFERTRDIFSNDEQAKRFAIAFKSKPYQVRLSALEFYGRMPAATKKALKKAFDPKLCSSEENLRVKSVCRQIATKKAGTP